MATGSNQFIHDLPFDEYAAEDEVGNRKTNHQRIAQVSVTLALSLRLIREECQCSWAPRNPEEE
jgi:hypothetical protein